MGKAEDRGVQGPNVKISNPFKRLETLQIISFTSNLDSYEVWLYNDNSLLPITMAGSSVKSTWS